MNVHFPAHRKRSPYGQVRKMKHPRCDTRAFAAGRCGERDKSSWMLACPMRPRATTTSTNTGSNAPQAQAIPRTPTHAHAHAHAIEVHWRTLYERPGVPTQQLQHRGRAPSDGTATSKPVKIHACPQPVRPRHSSSSLCCRGLATKNTPPTTHHTTCAPAACGAGRPARGTRYPRCHGPCKERTK